MPDPDASKIYQSPTESGASAAGSFAQSGENVAGRDVNQKTQKATQIVEKQVVNNINNIYRTEASQQQNQDRARAIDLQEIEMVRQQSADLDAAFEQALKVREAMEQCSTLIMLTTAPLDHFQREIDHALTLLNSMRSFCAEIDGQPEATSMLESLTAVDTELSELYRLDDAMQTDSVRNVNHSLRQMRNQMNELAQTFYSLFKSCRLSIERRLGALMLPPREDQTPVTENQSTGSFTDKASVGLSNESTNTSSAPGPSPVDDLPGLVGISGVDEGEWGT